MSDPFVKIIAHSISDRGIPLVTVHMRYWRAIHAEVMTHRCFSRNARSSRAVPIEKLLAEITNDPFIPRHWGKNQKGMQAGEELDDITKFQANAIWLGARNRAYEQAQKLAGLGLHKQITNRILEPFMWIDTLVTSTSWNNFFHLRDHKDAEPHFRDLAQLAKEAIITSTPEALLPGQWHLPYVTQDDWDYGYNSGASAKELIDCLRKVSAARCARISYAPFDGNGSLQKEIERHDLLVAGDPVHASPVEHQATPDTTYYVDVKYPKRQSRFTWDHPEEHRNFRGWRQYRAFIPNETRWG